MTEEKVVVEEVKCKEEGCKGVIDRNITVDLQTGCCMGMPFTTPAHPCNDCGRLYWGEKHHFDKDSPVEYYDDLKVFRNPKDGKIILKDKKNQFVSSFKDYVEAEQRSGGPVK